MLRKRCVIFLVCQKSICPLLSPNKRKYLSASGSPSPHIEVGRGNDESSTTPSLYQNPSSNRAFVNFDPYHQGHLLVTELLSQDVSTQRSLLLLEAFISKESTSLLANFASLREIHSGSYEPTEFGNYFRQIK